MPLTPQERALRARIAAHTSWANTKDPSARTAPGRKAAQDRFLRLADPDGTLEPAERERRAEHLRRAFYARLSLAGVKARRQRQG